MEQLLKVLFAVLIGTGPLLAQTGQSSKDLVPQPRQVTYCELSKDPAAYNHELVRLTAFITHGFEDFQVADPTCSSKGFSVWVMYGGKAQSGTVYCCPGEGGGARSQSLTVEGMQIPLLEDVKFQQFRDLLKKEPDTTVRVTVAGRFFSGEKKTINGSTVWGGAGHLGCCSLFVIQRVESFEPHTRNDLDYTAEGGWYEEYGCKAGSVSIQRHAAISYPDETTEQAIADQRKADAGENAWMLSDPQRVALESLRALYPDQAPVLRNAQNAAARQVYRWKNGKNRIVVVVARPYWLSFYASSGSVIWVSTMVKEAECK